MSDRLSRRELQCLRLAGEELANKDIAARLGIAPSTVENHLTNAYAKLGTSDRRTAAAIAARDYPDISRFAPSPMALPGQAGVNDPASGDHVVSGREPRDDFDWFLPSPPRRLASLLGLILVFAAVGGVITVGLVQLAAGGVSTLSSVAPPDGARTLKSNASAGTAP